MLPAILCLGLLLPVDDSLEAAGLSFAAPADFERMRARPPLLHDSVLRRLATEMLRLRVFVVPAAFEADRATRIEAAEMVASGLVPEPLELAESAEPGTDRIELDGTIANGSACLIIVPETDRHVAVLLYGDKTTFDRRHAEIRGCSLALTGSASGYPEEPGDALVDHRSGLAIRPPRGFERQPIAEDASDALRAVAIAAGTPMHTGLRAALTVSACADDLELDLADAAARLRGRMQQSGDLETLTAFGPVEGAAMPAFRIEGTTAERSVKSLLVDAGRQRMQIDLTCPTSRAPLFDAAFARCLASVTMQPPRIDPALALAVSDGQAGISLRPPAIFERVDDPDATFAFRETFVRGEPAALAVRMLGRVPDSTAEESARRDFAGRRADERARQGYRRAGERVDVAVSGLTGERIEWEKGDTRGFTCLLFVPGGPAEIDAAWPAAAGDALRPLLEASLSSFRSIPRAIERELDVAASSADGRVALRPPQGFARADAAAGALKFTFGDPVEITLEAGIEPQDARFASPETFAGRYAAALSDRLEAEGARFPRVEEAVRVDAGDDGSGWMFRAAFEREKRALRALHFVIPRADGIWFARATSSGGDFGAWRAVLAKSVQSLRASRAP